MTVFIIFKADIDAAVKAAKAAFHRNSKWRLLSPSDRGALLNKFADLIERDAEYLSQLETLDNGMLCSNTKMFVGGAAKIVRYIASLADKVEGSTIPIGEYWIFIY